MMTCSSIFLLLSLALTSLHTEGPHNFTTTMLASQLATQHAMWEHDHGRNPKSHLIMIPMLDIYSPAGQLIYHGTYKDTAKAAQVLKSLPTVPSPAPSPDDQVSLAAILESTPELAKWKDTILARHDFVVVSISVAAKGLTPKSPYYLQNHAVDSIPKRSGVDIDVVRINIIFN